MPSTSPLITKPMADTVIECSTLQDFQELLSMLSPAFKFYKPPSMNSSPIYIRINNYDAGWDTVKHNYSSYNVITLQELKHRLNVTEPIPVIEPQENTVIECSDELSYNTLMKWLEHNKFGWSSNVWSKPTPTDRPFSSAVATNGQTVPLYISIAAKDDLYIFTYTTVLHKTVLTLDDLRGIPTIKPFKLIVCPDCNGLKTIALLTTVVKCERCCK